MRNQLTILFAFIFIACNGQSSKETELWEPVPKEVYSKTDSAPPTDAIILFDGKDLSNWKARWSEKESQWQVNDDGSVTVVFDGTGGIQTKENFGSVQLHIEWKTSEDTTQKNQSRSNSGVFFTGQI
jgi:hypothetical protein